MSDDQQRRNTAANAQWGGRFAAGPSLIMQEINASIGFDRKLWRRDSRPVRTAFGGCGLPSPAEHADGGE